MGDELQLLLIDARIREAIRILKLMPSDEARYLGERSRAQWPIMMRESFDQWVGYGREKATAGRKVPTSVEIERMDEVLNKFLPALHPDELSDDLPPDTLRIVWWRCAGFTWAQVQHIRGHLFKPARGGRASVRGGNSRPQLRLIYRRALYAVLWRLKRDSVRLAVPPDWDDAERKSYLGV